MMPKFKESEQNGVDELRNLYSLIMGYSRPTIIYSPKTRANIRKVYRTIARHGVF